jgi:hypothetical protein
VREAPERRAGEDLAGGAPVAVGRGLVDEAVGPEGAPHAHGADRRDAGPDPPLLEGRVVGVGAVRGVRHRLGAGAPRGPGVLLEEALQQVLVRHLARGHLQRRNQARPPAGHPAVHLVGEAGGDPHPLHQPGLRVGAAQPQVVHRPLGAVRHVLGLREVQPRARGRFRRRRAAARGEPAASEYTSRATA